MPVVYAICAALGLFFIILIGPEAMPQPVRRPGLPRNVYRGQTPVKRLGYPLIRYRRIPAGSEHIIIIMRPAGFGSI
jgi:hypothetical protein